MKQEELFELVRVIGKDGRQFALMPLRDAIKLAKGDHLIKLAINVSPPFYRIVDSKEYLKNFSN